ncbi:hypothetical protein O181_127791 [Austropuccinia psidii MF-1]|uniref:Uncharacterized protein n=1 Tax=Austropuccinia psidii MF-1 TaxID=1389203 RepID=A0A9Q3KWW3_9BASI|nr:hypothetical protein [Austropuccinia psidii MF-1]
MTSKHIKWVIMKLIIQFYLRKELTLPQQASVDIYKDSHSAYNNALQLKGVPDPFRPVGELHEFLTDCEKILGPSQYLQIAQWMASIEGEENHDALDTRMVEKQPSTAQASAKNSPSGQQKQFQREKAATSSIQGQRKTTSHQTLQPGLQHSKNST